MQLHPILSTAVIAGLLLSACGKQTEAPATIAEAAPAAAEAAIVAGVPEEAHEALAAAPPAGVNGKPVDVCALIDSADAIAVAGKLYKEPTAQPAQGSLLGQCDYMGDKAMLMVSARPSAEYKGTVDYAAKKGGAKAMEGLGSAADMTPMGLMIQPAGKPYFIMVYTMAGGQFDEAAALAIGRKLKL